MLLKLPRASAAALFESVADAAAAVRVRPDRAISCARAQSSERPVPPKLPRESESSFDRERSCDAAAALCVTPDRAISGARAEQRAACAAQASEREQEQH